MSWVKNVISLAQSKETVTLESINKEVQVKDNYGVRVTERGFSSFAEARRFCQQFGLKYKPLKFVSSGDMQTHFFLLLKKGMKLKIMGASSLYNATFIKFDGYGSMQVTDNDAKWQNTPMANVRMVYVEQLRQVEFENEVVRVDPTLKETSKKKP